MDMGRRAEKRQLYREEPEMHGKVKMDYDGYNGCACLAQDGKTKTSRQYGSSFSLDAGTECPELLELVQKELEDHICPRRPDALGSHVKHG